MYRAHIAFIPERGEWLCIIVNRFTHTEVTLGCFHFRAQAERWARDAIKRKAWRDGSELPDIYG